MKNQLRPTKLEDVVGQKTIKQRLEIIIGAAKNRQCSVPHTLFYGPAGTGKSTLALAVANEIGTKLHQVNAGNVNSPKDILPTIFKLQENDILFIDEIHRLNIKTCEMLYTIMEDFIFSSGEINMGLDRFTMIGATTKAGSLSKSMLDRFVYKMELKLYDTNDLADIIRFSADKMDIGIDDSAALTFAKVSRGTPRVANQMITWARDYVQSKGSSFVSDAVADDALRMMGIDANGLTEADRTYIRTLEKSGRAMGLKSISDASSLDIETIENIIEPFLLQKGMIERTTKGRVLL